LGNDDGHCHVVGLRTGGGNKTRRCEGLRHNVVAVVVVVVVVVMVATGMFSL
jgi:hypothetical protein